MAEKITVQRANVVLDISPEQKDYYLNQGYNVIDSNGRVVEETKSLTVDALNRKVTELQSIIKVKDAEIKKLKEQILSQNTPAQPTPVRKTRAKRAED